MCMGKFNVLLIAYTWCLDFLILYSGVFRILYSGVFVLGFGVFLLSSGISRVIYIGNSKFLYTGLFVLSSDYINKCGLVDIGLI